MPTLIGWQIQRLVEYPGWRGATRRSVRYTGRTSLTVAMSCRRVERHTGFYRVPIDQTDGDRPSREGIYPDPGEYRGRPQLLYRATLLPQGNAVHFLLFSCVSRKFRTLTVLGEFANWL